MTDPHYNNFLIERRIEKLEDSIDAIFVVLKVLATSIDKLEEEKK